MALSTLKQVATPFVAVAKWYTACAKQHPLATAFWTSGIKTSAADLFAQKVIEGRDEIDVKRHLLFCAFGFGYLGSFQYYLYNIKFVQWCAPISNVIGHTATAPFKVFLDQCVHHPFLYFPVFYGLKAGVERKPLSYAVEKYEDEIWESLKALWAVWVPSQLVNFAFVPRHFRVPWVAMTSFVWTIILSLMQGRFDSARAGVGNTTDEHASAHYAAMQIHAGIPVDVPAVITALETATPATALLPPSAAAALESDSPAAAAARRGIAATRVSGSGSDGGGKPVAGSPLEPRRRGSAAFEYSFSPYSMAARVAAAAVCR